MNKENYGPEMYHVQETIQWWDRTLSHMVIDIETLGLGLRPVIVAIGAVALDEHYEVIGRFYRAIRGDDQPGRDMDFDTVKWWVTKNSPEAQQAVFNDHATSLRQAVIAFNAWVTHHIGADPHVQFWGKGPEFDNVIWREAIATNYPGGNPEILHKVWTYRNNQSLRTVERLVKSLGITVEVPDTGIAHHALHDAEWEAKYLRQAMHKILALAPKPLFAVEAVNYDV